MKENKSKIYLIVIAVVVALALVWFFVLRDDSSDTTEPAPQSQQAPAEEQQPAEDQQPADDGSGEQDAGPQTDLGRESAAVLALHQAILDIQQQYSDSCPTEEVVLDVNARFDAANAAGQALIANMAASTDRAAIDEALMYQQQGNAIVGQLATLGPEILQRCNLGHLVPAAQ